MSRFQQHWLHYHWHGFLEWLTTGHSGLLEGLSTVQFRQQSSHGFQNNKYDSLVTISRACSVPPVPRPEDTTLVHRAPSTWALQVCEGQMERVRPQGGQLPGMAMTPLHLESSSQSPISHRGETLLLGLTQDSTGAT